ncbi:MULTISPECIES: 1,2-phenylacetyl-CoA epoxidase subunit PaaD [Chromobacterium]|uniref:1,2-phenylacetyl-CoA epoxidase subunit PaaD n=1 Tax=Chromobacterium aquaticum TaxID=467180 RepID=A0ABV8ZPX7_9NEIS|nr:MULTISPECIES: 1,2-phenylacetyl-CoA epoxidase subunit PaaD [Chromobacterium]KMN35704.1 phenylacetate-CoA oxygenase [Chromobacterium sp. LK1]MCD5361207.1 phenylacetate-CoA oxygenase subunit PaaJ [Chromobacterium aquaticum]
MARRELTVAQAWRALERVPDPEVPVVSLCELGIVRRVRRVDGDLEVTLTPTYSGCPATEAIAASVRQALGRAGETRVVLRTQLSPPWTTDWISAAGRDKLRRYGIAPPEPGGAAEVGGKDWQPLRFQPASPACPRCGSRRSRRLSQFGATACKALYRCEACLEPFEYFKPI